MRFCIIDTALGAFGLAWSPKGLRRVLLPGDSRGSMTFRLMRVAEPAQPAQLPKYLMDGIEAYGAGDVVDFSHIALDLSGVTDFNTSVYADIMGLRWGTTTTYGEIARRLGDIGLSRAVGQAMGRNPVPLIVPCHRVLAQGGRIGGFSAPGGSDAKLRMLAHEGVSLGPPPPVQLDFAF